MKGVRRTGAFELWRINVPQHIAVEVELALINPLSRRPTYGLRSQLVTSLLVKWLTELKQEKEKPTDGPNSTDPISSN